VKNRLFRWSVRLLAAALLSLVAGVTLLVGTDTGSRWLLDASRPYLPPALELDAVQGSLLRGISIDSLRWRTDSADILVRGLSFDIELRPLFRRNVVIRSLVAQSVEAVLVPAGSPGDDAGGDFAVDLPVGLAVGDALIRRINITRGDFERRIDSVELAAALHGPGLQIDRFRLTSSWLTLGVQGKLRLAPAYRADLVIDWRLRDLAERDFAGQLRVDGNAGAWGVEHALKQPVAVATSGSVKLVDGVPVFDLLSRWRELELQLGQRLLLSPEGSLLLRGNPSAFGVELQAEAGVDDLPVSTLSLVGEATREDLRFSELKIGNEIGELVASGTARWLPQRSAEIDFAINGVDPSLAHPRLSGQVDAEGRLSAWFDGGGLALEARVDAVSGLVNDQPLGGSGELAFGNSVLSFTDVELAVGDNRLRATGALGPDLRVDGEFEIPALGQVDPGLSGSVAGDVALRGPRTRPSITLALRGEQLARGSLAIGSARAALSGYPDEHELSLALERGDGHLEVEANGGLDGGSWAGSLQYVAVTAGGFGT
jgi:translocation and assembly module TamB